MENPQTTTEFTSSSLLPTYTNTEADSNDSSNPPNSENWLTSLYNMSSTSLFLSFFFFPFFLSGFVPSFHSCSWV